MVRDQFRVLGGMPAGLEPRRQPICHAGAGGQHAVLDRKGFETAGRFRSKGVGDRTRLGRVVAFDMEDAVDVGVDRRLELDGHDRASR
jgi:hypothetical protein